MGSEKLVGWRQGAQQLPTAAASKPQSRSLKLRFLALVGIALYGTFHLLYRSAWSPLSPRYIHVPSLSPTFVAHCHDLLEAPDHTFTDRLARLSHLLSSKDNTTSTASGQAGHKGIAWIAEPGASALYFFGGFGPSSWQPSERPLLLAVHPTADGQPTLTILTPKFEELRARLKALPAEVSEKVKWVAWQENESPYTLLWRHLQGEVDGVIFDAETRDFIASGIRKEVSHGWNAQREAELERLERDVALLRQRKDEREIQLLRCANLLTLHAIRQTRKQMYIGISESQTSTILEREIAKTGLEGKGGLVLFGENAALPHGSGTNRKLGKHDLALIDVGGVWGGYVADITRTFALPDSKIPKKYIEIWEAVRKAQYAPYELLRQSNSTKPPKLSELDVASRAMLDSILSPGNLKTIADGPDFSVFTHRLGHGIGLEGHEAPYLVQGPLGETRALSGHTFSLEPGVYLPRGGGEKRNGLDGLGIRLEDCFVVAEDADGRLGGEWLSGPVKQWGDI